MDIDPDLLCWHAAATPEGRWRVVRWALPPEPLVVEACSASGRASLFKTLAAAERRAKELNAEREGATGADEWNDIFTRGD